MWTCSCGSDNEEEAFACTSCGNMKISPETSTEPYTPTPREGEEFQHMREEIPPSAHEHEMEKTYETLLFEEREAGKGTARKVLRITVVSIMSLVLVFIAILSVIQISGIKDTGFPNYINQCIGVWIRSIIMTQAVVIIGGIFLFLLREPKEAKT